MAQSKPRSKLSPISLPNLNQTVKNIRRMRQILAVLARHGFSHFIEVVGLQKHLPFVKKPAEDTSSRLSMAERLCRAFEELGPTFVKLGQMFASRPDLVTPAFAQAFERLRDDAKPLPVSEIRPVIEEELDGSVDSLFASFDNTPMAAASIAQVHGVNLHEGQSAVVKIQRPGIAKTLETDLSILYLFAKLAERYIPEISLYDPVGIVDEFAHTVKKAVDFIEEAHNIDAIHQNFSDSTDVVIPTIYWELTSKRVLTMERIEGIPLHNIDRLKSEIYDLKKICAVGVDAFFKQVFIDGLFHADLHAGNIFVLPENRIAFVDFGEVGRIGTNAQTSMANIFVSLLAKDFYSLAREYVELGKPLAPIDMARFADDLEKFLTPLFGRKIRDVRLGDVLIQAAGIAANHRIRLPRDLVLVGRVVITMEDLVRKLDPDFDVLEHGGRIAAELVKKKLKPERLARDLVWNLRDLGGISKELPTQIRYVMQRLSNNELTLQLELKSFARGISELDRASNRVAFAVVIAGLVIGSSILTFSDRGPQYLQMPIFGLVGYVMAGLLGFGLLVSILRSKRL